jgi:FkbM family methyltransferase
LLDRPGGRFILERAATRIFSRAAKADIEFVYMDGLWTHRVGGYFFPDSAKFAYGFVDFNSWVNMAETYISQAKDFWFWDYKPQLGDVVVDVGAGRGEDALAFSQAVGLNGRVIAIEAHPLSFAVLKNFCSLNGLRNVTPIHAAVMEKAGTVRIGESASWIENAIVGRGGPGIEVEATTVAQVFEGQGLNEVAFLKMNIEGAERQALPGMASVLPLIRRVCVACHDFRAVLGHGEEFRTRAFVEGFLADHQFTLTSRPDDPRDYVRDHVFGVNSAEKNKKTCDDISS